MEFLKALAELQDSISAIVKNADNPYFKSKYTDLNAIFDEIKPKIREKGFILIQTVNHDILHTELVHMESGEKITSDMQLLTADPNMQQLGSAITYARRYSILPLLNIECEDDDGNKAVGNEVKKDELPEDVNEIATFLTRQSNPRIYYREIKERADIPQDLKNKLNKIMYPKG
jgi:hypothetical protein